MMSSRTHNEFGIQFTHKRLPNFADKAELSVRHNDLWNTTKSIPMANKDSQCYINGGILGHERKCAILVEWQT
jgi:hypothetical protein